MTHSSSLEMNGRFYNVAVKPLLRGIPHAAALLGWGSDVLGYDTARSTDHGYGPRLLVFVKGPEVNALEKVIDEGLPETFEGFPVRFGWDAVPATHHVTVITLSAWLAGHLGFLLPSQPGTLDWLLMPQQRLLEVTRGRVYADDSGELAALRTQLEWYPDHVWRWLLACQWNRIAEEEAFVGRTSEVGDEIGSRIVSARLARDVIRLAMLIARRYAPYSKWLGTAFSEIPDPQRLGAALSEALTGDSIARHRGLATAYRIVADRCNALGLIEALDSEPRAYHSRPFQVIMAGRFAAALAHTVHDPVLKRLPLVGSADQFADSTTVTNGGSTLRHLQTWYERVAADSPGASLLPQMPLR